MITLLATHRRSLHVFAALLTATLLATSAWAQSLRSTGGSLDRQNRAARQHDYTFLDTKADVRRFVSAGYLVPMQSGRYHELKGVSQPFTRPAVKLFIERLARQYYNACEEKLVVTSLTRPRRHQPPNASPRSVHPTGMALDLRRSKRRKCARWMRRTLLELEGRRVLEASEEHRPPHFHLALFPNQYVAYLERRGIEVRLDGTKGQHRVARGDTLWGIASRYSVSVSSLKRANQINGSKIFPGQQLRIPTTR